MRIVTWCEPEWKTNHWEVRQITEHLPNLFQRLILRQVPRTVTRRFTNMTMWRHVKLHYEWHEHREDGSQTFTDLDYILTPLVSEVQKHGTFEDILEGRKPEAAVKEVYVPTAIGSESLVVFQKELEEIKKEREAIKASHAQLVANSPRTLRDMLNTPYPQDMHGQIMAEAKKINFYQSLFPKT